MANKRQIANTKYENREDVYTHKREEKKHTNTMKRVHARRVNGKRVKSNRSPIDADYYYDCKHPLVAHVCTAHTHIHALTHKFAHFIPQYFRRFFSSLSRCCCWFCHSFVLLSFEKHVFQFFFRPFFIRVFFSLSFLCILFAQFSSLSAQVFFLCFVWNRNSIFCRLHPHCFHLVVCRWVCDLIASIYTLSVLNLVFISTKPMQLTISTMTFGYILFTYSIIYRAMDKY